MSVGDQDPGGNSNIVRLLENEALVFPTSGAPVPRSDPWREKVIHWFFSVVAALERRQPAGVEHPFNRAAVHVTTALMDSYLASLVCERSARFRRDKTAYQVLATSCLLLGMRIVHHHQRNEVTRQQQAADAAQGEMRRSTKQNEHMDQQADRANEEPILEIPNASSLLRISAAPKSITEEHALAMIREITSSRVFSRSQSVTALDYINEFSPASSSGSPSSPHGSLRLTPSQERNAILLADAGLFCVGCRPSVVAAAAITIAMLRTVTDENDMSSVRGLVLRAIFGDQDENNATQAVRAMEIILLRAATPPRNNQRAAPTPPSAHVIPEEE